MREGGREGGREEGEMRPVHHRIFREGGREGGRKEGCRRHIHKRVGVQNSAGGKERRREVGRKGKQSTKQNN